MNVYKYLTSFICVFIFANSGFAQIPAFPGAEGFGTLTKGGRGGIVLKVTNLKDNGPGSLRAAIEYKGPRIITFEIGGIINLETELKLLNPFVTIAGQTASGDGICIRGEGINILTHDVVIRFLRIRPGDIDFGPKNNWDGVDAITIGNKIPNSVYNIVIDHCSLSWAVDENIGIWGDSHDITIQNCIIAEALLKSKHPKGDHGMGMLINNNSTNISIHHNIFAHNNDRNPYINGHSTVDLRNNIIYNPGGAATDVGANNYQIISYVNNMIIDGPRSRLPADFIIRNLSKQKPKVYINGNKNLDRVFKIKYYLENNTLNSMDTIMYSSLITEIDLKKQPIFPSVTTFTPTEAYDFVINSSGATLPSRDPVDKEVIKDIQTKGDGMVNTKQNTLEWPIFNSGLTLIDNDNDGMPDYWEQVNNLNIANDDNSYDNDGDGYTNIEEYLNRTDPNNVVNESQLFNNILNSNLYNSTNKSVKLNLNQNYPNPCSDSTNLMFSLNMPAKVSIDIFENSGKYVGNILKGFLYEGKYHILWECSSIKPGIYNIVFSSGNKNTSIQTVIQR